MNNQEYKASELAHFNRGESYFDSVRDFISHHESCNAAWFQTQLEWVENGSYGAGACFALRDTWERIKDNSRVNKPAHVGKVLLHALNGGEFSGWQKLPKPMQTAINSAVESWIESEKDFAINY